MNSVKWLTLGLHGQPTSLPFVEVPELNNLDVGVQELADDSRLDLCLMVQQCHINAYECLQSSYLEDLLEVELDELGSNELLFDLIQLGPLLTTKLRM